jgi:5-methyltetrahydrofolate--homocysteine methyltransferase
MTNPISSLLRDRPFLLADGSTSSNLARLGFDVEAQPVEVANCTNAELVREHYRSYLAEGSDVILTNSWAGSACRLQAAGVTQPAREINVKAAALLKEVIGVRPVICAGSVGPLDRTVQAPDDDHPPDAAFREISFVDAIAQFEEQAGALKEGGADIIWIETVPRLHELEAAIAACANVGMPYAACMTFNDRAVTESEEKFAEFVSVLRSRPEPSVAFGSNCGFGASVVLSHLVGHTSAFRVNDVLIAKANCGTPRQRHAAAGAAGLEPHAMAEYAKLAIDCGARVIGGCCGTLPEHVGAMRRALETHQRRPPPEPSAFPDLIGEPKRRRAGD